MDIRISQQAKDTIPDILLKTCLARSRQRFDVDRLRISPTQKVDAKGILDFLGVTEQEINLSSYLQGTLTVVATPTCIVACLTDELPKSDAGVVYTRHATGGNPFFALWGRDGCHILGQGIANPNQSIPPAGKEMVIEDGQHRGRFPSNLRDGKD